MKVFFAPLAATYLIHSFINFSPPPTHSLGKSPDWRDVGKNLQTRTAMPVNSYFSCYTPKVETYFQTGIKVKNALLQKEISMALFS